MKKHISTRIFIVLLLTFSLTMQTHSALSLPKFLQDWRHIPIIGGLLTSGTSGVIYGKQTYTLWQQLSRMKKPSGKEKENEDFEEIQNQYQEAKKLAIFSGIIFVICSVPYTIEAGRYLCNLINRETS
jgi:hypothetical protein